MTFTLASFFKLSEETLGYSPLVVEVHSSWRKASGSVAVMT